MAVGAFDPDAWNGIVFDGTARGQRIPFAVRIGSKTGRFVDGEKVFDLVSTVGPHAPDGSYALVSWRNLPRAAEITLEWSRISSTTVVGRLRAPADVHLLLEAYAPGEAFFNGRFDLGDQGRRVVGTRALDGVAGAAVAQFVVATDRPVLGAATFPNIAQLQKVMDAGHLPVFAGAATAVADERESRTADQFLHGAAGLEFTTTPETRVAHFVASVGFEGAPLNAGATELLLPGRIDALLDDRARHYRETRPGIEGLFAGAPEAIGNTMFWNTLQARAQGLEFPSISRRWAKQYGGWVVGEWDCFFGSLLTGLEDKAQTSAAVRAILGAQTVDGVVPNVVGASGGTMDRSEPPVGAYIVWKNLERDGDPELLRWAYPRLKLWHEWWSRDRGDGQPNRDGNRNGLLEWGSDPGSAASPGGRGYPQAAKWESGMDDSPMYDGAVYSTATHTLDLDDVGLNSLYALDAECLAELAGKLGYTDDQRRFVAEYARVKQTMQDRLWNEADGIFENRFYDGRFSGRLSPTNFYPMIAGIATPAQARRMVREHLLNPREFWGEFVLTTVARNDPAFEDQYYWRGSIWGPTNYLVAQGLNRYGEDAVALQFAAKSYALFMEDWTRHGFSNEVYYAAGGNAGGDKHYTWGALLPLLAVEQYMDTNPWEGMRFGALAPQAAGRLSRNGWKGHQYSIGVGPDGTSMERDGSPRFRADAGVVVRRYAVGDHGVQFTVKTSRRARITTWEALGAAGLQARVRVDGREVKTISNTGSGVTFTVGTGEHEVAASW